MNEPSDACEVPADSLSETYNRDIRPFIDVIDNLRRLGLQEDVNLPNVVVVGDQSSGKSSIIEAISGIQLPRGTGIVTRCPLELQLIRIINKPWKAFLTYKSVHGDQQKLDITNPNEVEKCIINAQNQMCGSSKCVSKELITLRIESPAKTAPDLTLIDLPGIARIAVDGQPPDICNQIKRIIMDHVKNSNTVILCVVSANLDPAVNESINIARSVDPEGMRTLGVITKPDLADEANKPEVLSLLNNERIPLEKGYHMVKCRSQKELGQRLTLEQSIENETLFFESDEFYRKSPKSQLGIHKLASKITEELVEIIKNRLPVLKDTISSNLEETRKQLLNLPKGIPETGHGKMIYLMGLITDLNYDIQNCLKNGYNKNRNVNQFYEWRKYFKEMRTEIERIMSQATCKEFSLAILEDEILRKRGDEISGFLNFQCFKDMIINHIDKYKGACENLVKKMTKHTEGTICEIIELHFKHLPSIESQLKQIFGHELNALNNKLQERINLIFDEERLVYTFDSEFEKKIEMLEKDKRVKSSSLNKDKDNEEPSKETSTTNAQRFLDAITCYLKIVHTRLSDNIPMSIRRCLHVELVMNLKEKYISLATLPEVENSIMENKKTTEKRKELSDKIERLQKAKHELANF